MKVCAICAAEFDEQCPVSGYAEAGDWLAAEVWNDKGRLCPRCLESRAKLSMMYLHGYNT